MLEKRELLLIFFISNSTYNRVAIFMIHGWPKNLKILSFSCILIKVGSLYSIRDKQHYEQLLMPPTKITLEIYYFWVSVSYLGVTPSVTLSFSRILSHKQGPSWAQINPQPWVTAGTRSIFLCTLTWCWHLPCPGPSKTSALASLLSCHQGGWCIYFKFTVCCLS